MPIPSSDCPPDTTPDVCCNTLFLLGDRIRTVACNAVMGCADESCTQPFRSYTTVGNRIQDLLGDSVIVTLTSATNSPMTTTRQGRQAPMHVTRANFQLELRENGWPQGAVNSGSVIEQPDGNVVNYAAAHSMSHAGEMWQALVDAATMRNGTMVMFPTSTNAHVLRGGVSIGQLLPVGPQSYQVAWSVTVTVDAMLRKTT